MKNRSIGQVKMKKTLLFSLVFLIAFGNFAYASASLTCGSMMSAVQPMKGFSSVPTAMPCCKSHPCDCSIKASPTDVYAVLSQTMFEIGPKIHSYNPVPARMGQFSKSDRQLNFVSQKSPPSEYPLYDLYSDYRI